MLELSFKILPLDAFFAIVVESEVFKPHVFNYCYESADVALYVAERMVPKLTLVGLRVNFKPAGKHVVSLNGDGSHLVSADHTELPVDASIAVRATLDLT